MRTRSATRLHSVLAAVACLLALAVAPAARATDHGTPRPAAHAASSQLIVVASHHQAPNYDQDTPALPGTTQLVSTLAQQRAVPGPVDDCASRQHQRAPPGTTNQHA